MHWPTMRRVNSGTKRAANSFAALQLGGSSMHSVTHRDLTTLLNGQRPPCVSIYLPTHKAFPGNREDSVSFRNLVDQVDGALSRKYPKEPSAELRRRLHDLAADDHFWAQRLDGLAILGSHDTFCVFHLERPVPERVIVGD